MSADYLRSYGIEAEADCVKSYSVPFAVDENGVRISHGADDPGEELDRRARAYADVNNLPYEESFARILTREENRELVQAYAGTGYRPKPVPFPTTSQQEEPANEAAKAGRKIDALIAEYRREHPDDKLEYAEMLQAVLAACPDLKEQYSGVEE